LILYLLEHLKLLQERMPKGLSPPEDIVPAIIVREEFDDGLEFK